MPAGFLLGFAAAIVLASLLVAMATAGGLSADGPLSTVFSLVAQDLALAVTAVTLAAMVGRPRAVDFGLRPTPLWRAIAWTAAAAVAFYAFSLTYSVVLPDGSQDTLRMLGVDRGTELLAVAGVLVIIVAPFAEELFFRGFLYRALRNRFSVAVSAALIGLAFGSVHYAGPETLAVLVPLGVLGAIFCLLYERTGSLYPAIALHVVNNALAFAVTAGTPGAPAVAAACGVVALGACVLLPRRSRSAA